MSRRRTEIPAHWTPVQEAAYLTVHEYPGGAEALAPLVGKSQRSLDNSVNPDTDAKLGLDEAIVLQNATRDYRILHAMARTLGHSCVQLADLSSVSDAVLLDAMLDWDHEVGQTKNTIREAISDGDISPEEFEKIEREVFEDFARELAVLQRLRGLMRADRGKGRG